MGIANIKAIKGKKSKIKEVKIMENMKKAISLLNDKEFIEDLKKINSESEILSAFKEKSVELTHEELEKLASAIVYACSDEEGALAEEELDQISGGGASIGDILYIFKGIKWGWNMGKKFYKFEKKIYKKLGIN